LQQRKNYNQFAAFVWNTHEKRNRYAGKRLLIVTLSLYLKPHSPKSPACPVEFLYHFHCRPPPPPLMCCWVIAACQFNLFKLIREGSTRCARLGGQKESRGQPSLTYSLITAPLQKFAKVF
jgi:hypothetical protein